MSNKALNWAYDLDLAGPKKAVLIALADMADENHSCFPGQERLATMSGWSVKTVRRALQDLDTLELIKRQHRVGAMGYRTSDRYELAVGSEGIKSLPDTEPTGQSAHWAERESLTDSQGIPTGQSDRAIEPKEEPKEEPKDSSSDAEAPDNGFSDEVVYLCDLLATMVRANGHNVGTVAATWWRACERLMRLDNYTGPQIEWVMRWACERSEFWQGNIRSMSTLRKQFSTLKAQAMSETRKAKPQPAGHAVITPMNEWMFNR